MTRCLLKILACILCLVAQQARVDAARPPVQATADGERFLFVVDMSEDMERLQAETEATVYDMLTSGVYGQMLPGDTYGVWTFNKDTYAGRFPIQIWDPRKSAQLGAVAAAYLSGAPYEKSSDVQQMMGKLVTVIGAVSNLNVFIISDGSTLMRGTPFDKAINAEYKKRRRERNAAKRPFVTTLIIRNGWVISNTVTIAGEPIQLPERAVPEPPARKAVPSTPARAGATSTNKVIIIPSPVVQAPAPAPPKQDLAAPAPPSPKVIVAAQPTNDASPAVASAVPIKKPVPLPKIPDLLPDSTPPAGQIVTQSNIIAAAVSDTPPSKPVAFDNAPAVSSTANIAAPLAAAATAHPVEPAPTTTTVVEAPAVKRVPETSVVQSALAAILPEPIPVAAREVNATQTESESKHPTPIQGAALPIQGGRSGTWLFAFGGFLLASAFFLALVVIRRSRPAAAASLITQSMNRR